MFNPTISPHDKNTVLVSCDMTGAYITHDGGQSWRMFNLRGTVRFFVFDPVDPKVIYAQAAGLWRSADSGETWKLFYPHPSTVRAVQMSSDHADESIVADPDSFGGIEAMAVDPADSRQIYAIAVRAQHATLLFSRDLGESWAAEAALPEVPRQIWIDRNSPLTSRRLYIGGRHSLQLFSARRLQTYPAPSGVSFTNLSAGTGANGAMLIYGTSEVGAFATSDGGRNWRQCLLPGTGAKVRAVAASARHGSTAYLSYSQLALDGQSWMGVAKTTDAGHTWMLVWKETATAASNVHDAWITPRFGPDWGENPLMQGVSEENPDLCYATDLGRTLRTNNGGKTWEAVYSHKLPSAEWVSTGLDVTTSYGIHFDPFDRKRQFITYTDIGLFRSEDGGHSWSSSTQGVPKKWMNTTYWVEFDPSVRGLMWSVNSGTHDLPRPKMWRRTSPSEYLGGVCRSEDGGRTWVKSNSGMAESAVTHILLDPGSAVSARVLYVTAFGKGVYKSVDGGKSWRLKNNGIAQKEPFAWRLARSASGTLYLVVARRSENGSIANDGDGAIYRSTDGAESWQRVGLPSGVNGPNGLAVDPLHARLYLAAWGRAEGMHGEGGGIYLSDDDGRTWRQVLDRDQHVYDVTVDTRNPNKLYAAGFESSAWASTDRGEHWTRIAGFNFKWGQRVIADPEDPDKVFISTFGGSVWHGSASAKTGSLDIATPQLEPGR